jgi:hypothetical protein
MYVYKDDEGYKLPAEVVTKHYKEPNANICGTLTFKDDVISGFGSTNYLKTAEAINFNSASTWEIVVKAKCTAESANRGFISTVVRYSGINGYYTSSNTLALELSSSGTSFDIAQLIGKSTITTDTWFWAKYEFTGSAYNFYYSSNGINWNLENSVSSTTKVKANTNFILGNDDQLGTPVSGLYFDLSECYIKLNDDTVWRGINEYDKERNNYFALDYTNLSVNNLVLRTIKDNTESGETPNETPNETEGEGTDLGNSGTDSSGGPSTSDPSTTVTSPVTPADKTLK